MYSYLAHTSWCSVRTFYRIYDRNANVIYISYVNPLVHFWSEITEDRIEYANSDIYLDCLKCSLHLAGLSKISQF